MLVVPIVAWGKHHVAMAKLCIASLMAPGNLPDVESRLQIYTDSPGEFAGREVYTIEVSPKQKHHITAICYEQAMSLGHPIVPVASDMVCSAGMLAAIEKHAHSARLVMIPVLRAVSELMMPELPLNNGVINLPPRELCRIGFSKIHPLQLRMFRENMPSVSQPTTIFRRKGDTIVARGFHMHPIMMRLKVFKGMAQKCEKTGIDGEIVNGVDQADIHMVTDSDEMVVFDLSSSNYDWEPGWRGKGIVDALAWAKSRTRKIHRWFFKHECYLHAGEIERLPPDPWIDDLCKKLNA
jgi:hypothetical protein